MPATSSNEGVQLRGLPLEGLIVKGSGIVYVRFDDKNFATVAEQSGSLSGSAERLTSVSGITVPEGATAVVIRSDSDIYWNKSGFSWVSGEMVTDNEIIEPTTSILPAGAELALGIGVFE